MLCLEISRNDTPLCVAGLVNGMTQLGLMTINPDPFRVAPALSVDGVGGEEPYKWVEWVRQDLALGDIITIRLVDAENPDAPRGLPLEETARLEAGVISSAQERYDELRRQMKALDVNSQ